MHQHHRAFTRRHVQVLTCSNSSFTTCMTSWIVTSTHEILHPFVKKNRQTWQGPAEVLHIFHRHGPPSKERAYLFNGDISDRGAEAGQTMLHVDAVLLVGTTTKRYIIGCYWMLLDVVGCCWMSLAPSKDINYINYVSAMFGLACVCVVISFQLESLWLDRWICRRWKPGSWFCPSCCATLGRRWQFVPESSRIHVRQSLVPFHPSDPCSKEERHLQNAIFADHPIALISWIFLNQHPALHRTSPYFSHPPLPIFPWQVHILRGNHENEQLNERARSFGGGFAEECLAKYGPRRWDSSWVVDQPMGDGRWPSGGWCWMNKEMKSCHVMKCIFGGWIELHNQVAWLWSTTLRWQHGTAAITVAIFGNVVERWPSW